MTGNGEEGTSEEWQQHWDRLVFQICKISPLITTETKYFSLIWIDYLKRISLIIKINNTQIINNSRIKINSLIHINKHNHMKIRQQMSRRIKRQFFLQILLKMHRKMGISLMLTNTVNKIKIKIKNFIIFKKKNLMKVY